MNILEIGYANFVNVYNEVHYITSCWMSNKLFFKPLLNGNFCDNLLLYSLLRVSYWYILIPNT